MSFHPKLLLRALLFTGFCLFMASCTSGGGDDGNSDAGSGNPEAPLGERDFNTDCGTVFNAELQNPISEQDGEPVAVLDVAAPNALIIERNGGRQLVKLLGLRDNISSFKTSQAISLLRSLLGSAIFYPADGDCAVTVTGGGQGIAGSLFLRTSGRSFAEALLNNGAAEADSSSTCGANLVRNCYAALAEENGVETGASISNFLWKPVAERDGRLVVLLNPGGATVTANGETLTNTGPSNGRGTTARGSRPGCAYGNNVELRATDRNGRVLIWPGNALSYTIPSGCNRVEF